MLCAARWVTVAHLGSFVFRRSPVPAPVPLRLAVPRGARKGGARLGTTAGMSPIPDGVADARFDGSGLEIEIPLPFPMGVKRLQRSADEPVSKALARLTATIEKARKQVGRPSKKDIDDGQNWTTTPPTATLVESSNETEVSPDTSNARAWRTGVVLKIAGVGSYRVRVDAPFLETVSVAGHPTVGAPLVAAAGGTKHCDEETDLLWRWWRCCSQNEGLETRDPNTLNPKPSTLEEISQGIVYVPTDEDVGCRLLVTATPKPPLGDSAPCGESVAFTTQNPVAIATDRPDAWKRMADLGPPLDDGTTIRVMTYNVLADAYAHTWSVLYPYLRSETADPQRRLPLAMADIRLSQPDVVALQEIDRKWYHQFWVPQMKAAGYDPAGGLVEKTGKTREGCATFVKRDAWRVVGFETISLKQPGDFPGEEGLSKFIQTQPHLQEALGKISTVGLVVTLEPVVAFAAVGKDGTTTKEKQDDEKKKDNRRPTVVANAHLFFHPGATHVRVLQSRWLLRHAQAARDAYVETESNSQTKVALVVCGDFNAEPFDAAARFVGSGTLRASDPDWALGSVFRWGGTSSRAAAAELLAIDPELDAFEQEQRELSRADPVDAELAPGVPTAQQLNALSQKLGRMAASWRVASETERGARLPCGVVCDALPVSSKEELSPLQIAQHHAKNGCTFKTCVCVAAWQFRRDANMQSGVALRGLSQTRWPGAEAAMASDETWGGGGGDTRNGMSPDRQREDTCAPAPVDGPVGVHHANRAAFGSGLEKETDDDDLNLKTDADVSSATSAARKALLAHQAGLRLVSSLNASLESDAMETIELANEKSSGWVAEPIGGCAVHLRHPLRLQSACGFPEWTNFVAGFAGALDYIWCDTGTNLGRDPHRGVSNQAPLRPTAHAPMPSLESVKQQTALPNDQFPSDHLPMVADLRFETEDD